MTLKLTFLSLLAATILLASSTAVLTSTRVSAFDPGGPPVGGAAPSVASGNWEMINYGPNGGSYSPQAQITKDNVQFLETKWVFPITRQAGPIGPSATPSGTITPPLIVDGVVYMYNSDRRLFAVDATTGKIIWVNDFGNKINRTELTGKYPFVALPGTGHIHALNYYRAKGWLIPSVFSCMSYAVEAKTGKTAWFLNQEQICGTNAEFGDPSKFIIGSLNSNGLISGTAHPPQFLGNIMFIPMGASSGQGGRAFVTAIDMTDPQNPKRLYREFVAPPAQGEPNWAINECNRVNGNGWYFEYPKYLEGINHPARDKEPTYLATKCTDVDPEVVKNDWIDMVPGSNTFGKTHTSTAISPVWGTYPIDAETGIVYVGWGDQGAYDNLTNRYGPGLHGSGFTAFDVRTGKMLWWYQPIIHDFWDYDCSWAGVIGQVQGKKAFIKGCKNGIVYALDASTGKPFWVFDPPTILRDGGQNYGVDTKNDPKGKDACCRLTKEDMSKPWWNYPKGREPVLVNCYTTCLESDIAYDGKRVYLGSFNSPSPHTMTNVRDRGNNGLGALGGNIAEGVLNNTERIKRLNSNVYAVDANTGKQVWTYRIEQAAFRGGIAIAGGLAMVYVTDGNLKFLDAETGKIVHQLFFGVPVNVMPTIGANKEGKYQVLVYVGGGGSAGVPGFQAVDGALVAYGLPDKLPQQQVITKEVIKEVIKEVPKEVIKEVIKEVPKEVIKEVIKEVPKEVIKTVTVETISPLSYAAIGIGVVLVVIAGVLFSRRKKI